ncbi:MAG: c-type cytochrome [Burkholderiaceae bacterium]|nr:c-type cytochrome [Burkholderiaceae bacterium]MCD8517455.1 c-type cytochrome [Burkholderiaceae bacterium]MCD8537844.1 c-type cytochrome [Burkholderiaceae bacterium]MCD8566135.1 c-type cytochrome [Burkholderiaceae bacterium]
MRLAGKAIGLALASGALMFGISGAAKANDLSAERIYHLSLAATCASCHGTGGVSVAGNDMPKINELTHTQIAEILRQYKSGEKTGTIMPQIAKGYTEEQIDIIAKVLGHD